LCGFFSHLSPGGPHRLCFGVARIADGRAVARESEKGAGRALGQPPLLWAWPRCVSFGRRCLCHVMDCSSPNICLSRVIRPCARGWACDVDPMWLLQVQRIAVHRCRAIADWLRPNWHRELVACVLALTLKGAARSSSLRPCSMDCCDRGRSRRLMSALRTPRRPRRTPLA